MVDEDSFPIVRLKDPPGSAEPLRQREFSDWQLENGIDASRFHSTTGKIDWYLLPPQLTIVKVAVKRTSNKPDGTNFPSIFLDREHGAVITFKHFTSFDKHPRTGVTHQASVRASTFKATTRAYGVCSIPPQTQ